jgi:flagellar biosynthetic protein FliR
VVSEFLGLLALLIFMAINGHLMVIATLTHSFTAIPIGAALPETGSWLQLARSGALIFSSGLLLALPILVALLVTNLALAILSRAAPQLNLIVIGFPLTITLGFAGLVFGLSYLSQPIQQILSTGCRHARNFSPAAR